MTSAGSLSIGHSLVNVKVGRRDSPGSGGALETGRALNYLTACDEDRKMCSLYLSIMDRMGVRLERFGDADNRLERL